MIRTKSLLRWAGLAIAAVVVIVAVAAALLAPPGVIGGILESFRHPPKPFAETTPPPAPDYSKPVAWMAFPGRNGPERSVPPGFHAIDETKAPADVFFIHPTTYLKNDVWNAAYDVAGPYNYPVMLDQISAFNGCCLLYAPQYRQASLRALKTSPAAIALAYSDVVRAFRYYIANQNHGRPFIIAAHSQGSRLAVRLLQAEILGTPLQRQLIAAYVIGSYVPSNFSELGLPACDSARQTGCIVAWNTSQTGRTGALIMVRHADYWWQGADRNSGTLPAVCVNPLNWTENEAAPASANLGSLPFPTPPFAKSATVLHALTPHLTGAVCKDKLLDVDVPKDAPPGFHSALSFLYGSYHQSDYGLFYANIRANAIDRVAAFVAATPSKP